MSKKRAETVQEVVDWLQYITMDEANALQEIVRSLPDNPEVINIGAGAGTSGLAIIKARPDVRLTTVDITFDSNPRGCLMGETQVLKDSGVDMSNYNQIHGSSRDVTWRGELLDFVFVDGDHSSEGVRGDIDNWLPLIKKGGVIAFHDYKKEQLWMRNNPGKKVTLKLEESVIKSWKEVDIAVDEIIVDHYKLLMHVDTLIAFRI